MKGYIYLLKETGHKTTYKIGRTNNLKRRLAQYNTGKTKIPIELLESEGDVLKAVRFSKLDEDYKQLMIKNNDISKLERCIKEDWLVQLCKRHNTEYQFEYIHTVKVKDCIEAEGLLLHNLFWLDDIYGRMSGQLESEWFSRWDIQSVKDTMDEICEQINKRKYRYVKVPY
jgi:predicted GIY-YIG superfamily endonuclease